MNSDDTRLRSIKRNDETPRERAENLKRRLKSFVSLAGLLARDRSGNIALMTAVMLVPVMGMVGLGVDVWTKTNAQAELDAAADAATLAAINRASTLIATNVSPERAVADSKIFGLSQFTANVGKVPMTTSEALDLKVSIDGLTISAKADWKGSTKTTFGAMVGVKSMSIAGESAASLTLPSYVKIVMLLDTSESMGIGATEQDQTRLHDLTGCSVACHLDGYVPGESSYSIARRNNVVTRVDVLRKAIIEVAARAEQIRTNPDQFKIGLYTYDIEPREVLSIDSPQSSNMNAVRAAADSMTLTKKLGGTKLENASKWLRDNVLHRTKSGDGMTADRPKLYVMLITDGVETSQKFEPPSTWTVMPVTPYAPTAPVNFTKQGYDWPSGGLQAMNPARCDDFKNVRNVTVLPLQVTYPVSYTHLTLPTNREV